MTDYTLGCILKRMYDSAPEGYKVASIHIFGIYYADRISNGIGQIKEIIKVSELPRSYHTEVAKGVKLSGCVLLTDSVAKQIQKIETEIVG